MTVYCNNNNENHLVKKKYKLQLNKTNFIFHVDYQLVVEIENATLGQFPRKHFAFHKLVFVQS